MLVVSGAVVFLKGTHVPPGVATPSRTCFTLKVLTHHISPPYGHPQPLHFAIYTATRNFIPNLIQLFPSHRWSRTKQQGAMVSHLSAPLSNIKLN